MKGVIFDNDFGFGVVRTSSVRVWLGPELRIAFLSGDSSTTDFSQIGLGLGPVVGVNVNLGPVVSLGFKVGYLFNSYGGDRSGKTSTANDATYSSTEGLPLASFALIFRLGSDQ